MVDLRDELDGYTVSFTSLLEDIDATPFMKGLPDDRCQCPHWGYVIKGKMTARYADRDEVFEAGDASYAPPGPTPGAVRPWASAAPAGAAARSAPTTHQATVPSPWHPPPWLLFCFLGCLRDGFVRRT